MYEGARDEKACYYARGEIAPVNLLRLNLSFLRQAASSTIHNRSTLLSPQNHVQKPNTSQLATITILDLVKGLKFGELDLEGRTVLALDPKYADSIAELENVIIDWFSKKEKLIFQIRAKDVAQYATTSISSFSEEGLMEDLCKTLNASLLDAPSSIIEKIINGNDDHIFSSVFVVVTLLVTSSLPPPGLSSSILGIFLEGDGNDLTNHILDSQTRAGHLLGENLGKLAVKAESVQSLSN